VLGLQLVQVVATEAPTTEEYVPATHATQEFSSEAPVDVRYVPARQSTQALATVAPEVVRYLPALQSRHVEAPVIILYFPGAHASHRPPSGPLKPALQRQLVSAGLAATECAFAGHATQVAAEAAPTAAEYALAAQSVHAAEPEAVLNFPATHSTQACPSDAVAPALQVQAVRRADPDGEFEFAGQSWQVGLPSADHPPAKHGWHVSTPVAPTAAE